MPSTAGVSISNVVHWFVQDDLADIQLVLRGVTADIRPGEFVCLVGPSGCGKTTLLNMIAGVISAARGSLEVRVDDVAITTPSTSIGYMLARDALLPWRTAVQNVALGLELRHMGRKQRDSVATEALQLVGLAESARLYPSELSQGMRQRVNLARMLVTKPSLLLMDEPFGALDAITRERMQAEFLHIWDREKASVVFVTHDLQEAALLADRVMVMVDGQIAEEFVVPFERPRDPDELRFDPEFQRMVHQMWAIVGKQAGISE
jgi:NitT/TauT family transport system ATP-binding protein